MLMFCRSLTKSEANLVRSIQFNKSVIRYTSGGTWHSLFNTMDVYQAIEKPMPNIASPSMDFIELVSLVIMHLPSMCDTLFDELSGVDKGEELCRPMTDFDWTNIDAN